MGIARTLANRQRCQYFKCLCGLLIICSIFAVVSMGCEPTASDISEGKPTSGISQLPVAVTNPTTIQSSDLPAGNLATPNQAYESFDRGLVTVTSDDIGGQVSESNPDSGNTTLSLELEILAPSQGAALEVGAVRILGKTWADAQVSVNGIPTEVNPDGSFSKDLIIGEGINSVEAIAKHYSGQVASQSMVLLYVPRTEGVPLSILFPQGLEVSEPDLTIMGATRPDAVVAVNGAPVDVNGVGIFSTLVELEEGTNLIEIVAVDLEENVNFQTVVVFYIPQGM